MEDEGKNSTFTNDNVTNSEKGERGRWEMKLLTLMTHLQLL